MTHFTDNQEVGVVVRVDIGFWEVARMTKRTFDAQTTGWQKNKAWYTPDEFEAACNEEDSNDD